MNEHRCYGCMQLHDGDFCPHCGWPNNKNNEPHQLPVGTVLRGQYEVGRVLGQGGFGITYLGWDRHLETAVCIKEYFPNHAVSRDCTVSTRVHCHTEAGAQAYLASKERFLREGKILAQFRDIPEIVSIYGFFEENDTVYIVMEYIKGMDLARYIHHKGGRLTVEETFRILKPVMEAMAAVHRGELVHRDIAPDNIMLHPRGGAKLLDFGAARMVENADVDRGLDRSTEAIVKHGFAPMEQYQTRGNLGPWTDVYAMCATVYYCLTGQIPPEATSRMMGEAPFSWANVPGLTDRQRYALERGMAILPRDRYASMEELLEGLFGDAPLPVSGTQPAPSHPAAQTYPQPAAQQPRKKKGGRGILIGLAAVLAVAVLGVGGFLIALALSEGGNGVSVEAPAMEAPAWEAPMPAETEAPALEAPAVYEEYYVGVIMDGGGDEHFAEKLAKALGEAYMSATVECAYAVSNEEMMAKAEAMIASGADVMVLWDTVTSEDTVKILCDLSASCGVPVVLLGEDPAYETGSAAILEEFPDVMYADADPRYLADLLAGILPKLQPDPDKNANGSISYVYLAGETPSRDAAVQEELQEAMNAWGYAYSCLEYITDGAEGLREAVGRYNLQIEVIFCGDTAAAETAVMVCEEYGIDIWSHQVVIVALGDPEELSGMEAVTGYVSYSSELLADHVAEVLLRTFRGEETGGRQIPSCEVYISGSKAG